MFIWWVGGVYTTVEGLLNKIKSSLEDNNPFAIGDSARLHHSASGELSEVNRNSNTAWTTNWLLILIFLNILTLQNTRKFFLFLEQLEKCARGERFPFTLVIRDPLGAIFLFIPDNCITCVQATALYPPHSGPIMVPSRILSLSIRTSSDPMLRWKSVLALPNCIWNKLIS